MKLDFNTLLLDPKGEEFSDKATVGVAVYSAFMQPLPGDAQLPADKRLAQYRLLQKIGAGGEQEITVEEASEIKDRCAKILPLAAFGAVADILESAKVATLPQAVKAA